MRYGKNVILLLIFVMFTASVLASGCVSSGEKTADKAGATDDAGRVQVIKLAT